MPSSRLQCTWGTREFNGLTCTQASNGWHRVVVDGHTTRTKGLESLDVDMDDVSELKFVMYGNDVNAWTSLTSVEVVGC